MEEAADVQVAVDPTADRFAHAQHIPAERLARDSIKAQIENLKELFYDRLPTGPHTGDFEKYLEELETKLIKDGHDNTQPLLEEPRRRQPEHGGPRMHMDITSDAELPARGAYWSPLSSRGVLECDQNGKC